MLIPLEKKTLATGEVVEAVVVRGPEPAWAERLERMLRHKGEPWSWQNAEMLRKETGVEASFFVLHRGGVPFSNVMLVATGGVALLGHVWTQPADQRQGASSRLMELALDDFDRRGGRAIFLGAGFDTAPWHYYRRRGFEAVEPGSGFMARYTQARGEFERTWFGAAETVIEPFDWRHWPAVSPLFLGDFPGVVRIAATQLIGRVSEGPLLPLIRDSLDQRAAGEPVSAWALRDRDGAAVLGVASRRPHPYWPDTDIVDLYCHPRWWQKSPALLEALPKSARRAVAYCDVLHEAKREALKRAGFAEQAILPNWVAANTSGNARVDVLVLVRL